MPRAASVFKKSDIVRVITAVRSTGIIITGVAVEIDPNGKIRINVTSTNDNELPSKEGNEWDRVS